MMRSPDAAADLGGIGTMLINAEVCAACGEAHPEPRFLGIPLRLPGIRPCPSEANEAGPTLSHLPPTSSPAPSFALPRVEPLPDELVLELRPSRDSPVSAPWPVPVGVF